MVTLGVLSHTTGEFTSSRPHVRHGGCFLPPGRFHYKDVKKSWTSFAMRCTRKVPNRGKAQSSTQRADFLNDQRTHGKSTYAQICSLSVNSAVLAGNRTGIALPASTQGTPLRYGRIPLGVEFSKTLLPHHGIPQTPGIGSTAVEQLP